jgi:type I restriction enzyme S subunit
MSEWDEIPLTEIAISGRNNFIDGDWIEAPYISDEGVRLIQTGNIGINEFKNKNKKYISLESFYQLGCKDVYPGDILICRLAEPAGRACIVPNLDDSKLITSVDVTIFRVNEELFNKEFVNQSINTQEFLDRCQEVAGGTTRTRISRSNLGNLTLSCPPLGQQKKIAKILSTVDNLIETTQSLIDKYTVVKQGMMADLFSRGIDLTPVNNYCQLRPSATEAPELYQQTELGWVPKNWVIKTIEKVSLGGFKNGYFKDPKLVGSGTKLVNVTELYQDFGIDIIPDKVQRIQTSPKDFEKYKVEVGDLFFTRSSLVLEGIAKSNIVKVLPEEAVFECHVMRLKPNKEIVVPEFLALYTGMPTARSYFMSMAKQVTMTTIAQPDMIGLPIPIPSLAEQEMIVRNLDTIENLIRKETVTVKKNKEIKKGLMQDLLTGKVRVN